MKLSKKDIEAKKLLDVKYKDQFIQLCNLLFNIQSKTVLCPFIDMSGHVNKMSITIAKTKEGFNNKIFSNNWIELAEDNTDIIEKLQSLYDEAKKY